MRVRRLVTAGLAAALLCAVLPAVAYADDGRLVVDNAGNNGAVTGRVERSEPGSALIEIHNSHEFWTTIDLRGGTGVTLRPGPLPRGGPYAALGVLAPGESATWEATWNPRQAAQVSVLTTPYLLQTTAGGLAAALTVLTVVADVVTAGVPAAGRVGAGAEALRQAAALVGQLLGNDLATLVSVEGLTSGKLGQALFELLGDAQQVEVLREALGLFGVTASTAALTRLRDWLPAVSLLRRTLDLGWALLSGTSSGGVLFASAGTAALLPATAPPTTVRPTTVPPTTARPTAAPPGTATPTTAPPGAHPVTVRRTVTVGAAQPWTDSGVDVAAGDHLYIEGSGVIRIAGSDPGKETNGRTVGAAPPGYDAAPHGFTAPGVQRYGMVARIGGGAPFDVLASVSQTSTGSGRLSIGVNDDTFGDNAGAWQAAVKVCRGGTLDSCVTSS
jgi:hypothetical protein